MILSGLGYLMLLSLRPWNSDSICCRQDGNLYTQALWLPLRQLTKSYPDVSNFNSSRFCLMMLAIYIVVILECYYAFKERERSGLWRHFPLNASFEGHCLPCQREKWDKRGSPVRQPGSGLWTFWRMVSIVLTWSFCIFCGECTEPSEEDSCLQEFWGIPKLGVTLSSIVLQNSVSLDRPDGTGTLQYSWIQENCERKNRWVSWLFVELEEN